MLATMVGGRWIHRALDGLDVDPMAPGNEPGEEGTRLPAVPQRAARPARLRSAAAQRGFDGEASWGPMLAVTEAVANAVEHGDGGTVRVLIESSGDDLSVEVRATDPSGWDLAHGDGPRRGRGLPLMAEVVDASTWRRVATTASSGSPSTPSRP